jgi:hypothetical protein
VEEAAAFGCLVLWDYRKQNESGRMLETLNDLRAALPRFEVRRRQDYSPRHLSGPSSLLSNKYGELISGNKSATTSE